MKSCESERYESESYKSKTFFEKRWLTERLKVANVNKLASLEAMLVETMTD